MLFSCQLNVDGVITIAVLYVVNLIVYALITYCCYYFDVLTSCYVKGFLDPVRFHFRSSFLSLPCFVELNVVLGRLRHPLTTYVTVLGLALVNYPLFFFLCHLIDKLLPLINFLRLVCMHAYVAKCDSLGLHCTNFNWLDRYNNHANKNHLHCLQYPLHVSMSDVVPLLFFPDSTCHCCVSVLLL